MQALDYGKDVESVENLIRRHEEMEREISVIKSKIEVRSREVQRKLKKFFFSSRKYGAKNHCYFSD